MEISRVGVVGLGTMGAGIAQVCLQAGLEVVGREVDAELGEAARGRIDHYLSRGVEKERLTQDEKDAALGRLGLTTELADLAGCELVIEAVFEDLDVKRELFGELDRILPPPALLATNTSALSVTQIADATEHARARGRHALLQPGAGAAARRGRAHCAHERRGLRRRLRVRASGSARSPSPATTRPASSSTGS